MKENELRIDNWVKDRGGKEWQIDHWESANKVSAKIRIIRGLPVHPFTEYVDFLQPIPLTEKWLLTRV